MKLYNIKDKKIEDIELININKSNMYVSFLNDDELVKNGYKRVVEEFYNGEINDSDEIIKEISQSETIYKITHKLKIKNLDELKEQKQKEFLEFFNKSIEKSTTNIEGIGQVDAGNQYLINISGLIAIAEHTNKNIDFMLANNEVVSLNLEQLNKVKAAIALKGAKLYQIKWRVFKDIKNAKTTDELNAISWSGEEIGVAQ
ncbi:hypothetical protein KDE12_01175 [Campylobacter sp. faydin G-105]|uniref:DUF4376 domain-containing protein n=1 Tax=Campylobacter anatolicus TaxID=2829105 RepID=UPI001B9D3EE5|nr:DUF4376 domain-containing protein [Campylobacter anatolicus]MBR8461463.1 hypothetical protein [Campylobacter anatolicus]